MTKLKVVVSGMDFLLRNAMNQMIDNDGRFERIATLGENFNLVDFCGNTLPDVLFTDVIKNGKPCVSEVQELRHRFPSIHIYIVSNLNDFDLVQELLRIGIADYMLLPLSISKFSNLLNAIHRNGRQPILVKEFIELILTKDFNLIYQTIPMLVTDIQKQYKENSSNTSLQLEQVVMESLKMIHCTNPEQQSRYRERMHFSKDIVQDDYEFEFLLFYFFDEIYKQRTIQRKPQLSQIFHYVEEHIDQDISLSETAKFCTISQGYLSRVMKEYYGLGFNNYVQLKKIQLAKQAFYFNNDKIIDVAFQLSYSEPSYFSKVFKRIEHVAPSQFKKKMAAKVKKPLKEKSGEINEAHQSNVRISD